MLSIRNTAKQSWLQTNIIIMKYTPKWNEREREWERERPRDKNGEEKKKILTTKRYRMCRAIYYAIYFAEVFFFFFISPGIRTFHFSFRSTSSFISSPDTIGNDVLLTTNHHPPSNAFRKCQVLIHAMDLLMCSHFDSFLILTPVYCMNRCNCICGVAVIGWCEKIRKKYTQQFSPSSCFNSICALTFNKEYKFVNVQAPAHLRIFIYISQNEIVGVTFALSGIIHKTNWKWRRKC